MARATNYSDIRNLLLVVSFNQPAGDQGQDIQPVVVEARCEAVTTEGAIRNVTNKVNIGAVVQTPLTLKQIHTQVKKTTVGTILAGVLKDCVLEALNEDVSA